MKQLPLSIPQIEGNAWKYVKDCLDTNWVSSVGAYVGRFEDSVRAYTGAKHAVAGVNGTACLHAALTALDVGPGDGVLVPALTFIATANAVRYCGAVPLFIDCDPARYNLDLGALEAFLETGCRRRQGRLFTRAGNVPVKAVLPAHILGFPVDMERLTALARRHKLTVLEDAAESLGSSFAGRHTGTFGAAGVLSFNGNKIVTCGGGGMIITDDDALAKRLRHLTQQAKSHPTEYFHDEVGWNYRMTNLSAALGLSQMERLPRFLKKREQLARWYRQGLPGIPTPPLQPGQRWNHWLMGVTVASAEAKKRLLQTLNDAGCQARPLWSPLPLQKPYKGSLGTPIPQARRAYDTVINIPSSTSLTQTDVARVCRLLRRAPLTALLA
ncbi:MAG: LegC family aminotransferase [Elusimicrobiota bacterium]